MDISKLFWGKKKKKKGKTEGNQHYHAAQLCWSLLIPSCLCRKSKIWVYLVSEKMVFMGLSFCCVRTSPLVAFTPDIKRSVENCEPGSWQGFECAFALWSSSGARWAMEDIRKAEKEHLTQSLVGLGNWTSNVPLPSSGTFTLTHHPLLPHLFPFSCPCNCPRSFNRGVKHKELHEFLLVHFHLLFPKLVLK